MDFKLKAPYQPLGDQPQAIHELVEGIQSGKRHQVLLGATGTGKTFTIANVIQKVQRPALVLVHNKTLAAQLIRRIQGIFPRKRGGIFCVLLRLLPAGSLRSAPGPIH